jgi:hypothetical protein
LTDAPHPNLRALLAGLACLGLAARVRHPVGAALWVSAFLVAESALAESPDEIALLFVFIIVAYSVTGHAPLRRAWVGSLALGLAVSLSVAWDPSDSLSNILPTVILFVLVIVMWLVTR